VSNWWDAPEWEDRRPMDFGKAKDGPTYVIRVPVVTDDQDSNALKPYDYVTVFGTHR
jgi:hypothetical protein